MLWYPYLHFLFKDILLFHRTLKRIFSIVVFSWKLLTPIFVYCRYIRWEIRLLSRKKTIKWAISFMKNTVWLNFKSNGLFVTYFVVNFDMQALGSLTKKWNWMLNLNNITINKTLEKCIYTYWNWLKYFSNLGVPCIFLYTNSFLFLNTLFTLCPQMDAWIGLKVLIYFIWNFII